MVIHSSKQSVIVVKERLNKNPIDYAKNTIYFLNGLTEEELNIANIKYRISIITWARKVVNKQHHLDIIEAKMVFVFKATCARLPYYSYKNHVELCVM